MCVVKSLARFLLDLLYFLTGEGSWGFRPHENLVINAAINFLPENSRGLLYAQLGQATFVQRSHKQICRPRFYISPYLQDQRTIEDVEYFQKIIDVQVDVSGVKEIAQVEFFRGRVDSIQFKRPAKYYADKKMSVIGVRSGSFARSHAAEIDRREHGKER